MSLSIPPEVLAPLVVGGVSFVVVLTWWVGWAEPTEIPSREAAEARYLYDFPDDVVRDVVLADDRRSALLWVDSPGDAAPRVRAVTVLGHHLVVRRLAREQVRALDEGDDGLRLKVRDFGGPSVWITLSDPEVRATWRDRLAPSREVARA